MPATDIPSRESIRAAFPALASSTVFLENAGGSQMPACVMDAIAEFCRTSYAQIGAAYPESETATHVKTRAHHFLNLLFGGEGLGEVAIGPSSTALMQTLAWAMRAHLKPGDEVILSESGHESSLGPWVRLEEFGVKVVWWKVDPTTGESRLDDLAALLSDRTRVVCFTQTCNLLGDIVDPAAVVNLVRPTGACVIVDSVAAASHAAVDVAAWGVDFCCVSMYKVYGPHVGALWGRREWWDRLKGPNHFFIGAGAPSFELGCLPYELLAGVVAVGKYFEFVTGREPDREGILAAFGHFKAMEQPLVSRFLEYAQANPRMKLFGPPGPRHPTFGFVIKGHSSRAIVDKLCRAGIGCKYGHFYAYRMCEALGLDPADGVARISAVHYNSVEEMDRVIEVLDGL